MTFPAENGPTPKKEGGSCFFSSKHPSISGIQSWTGVGWPWFSQRLEDEFSFRGTVGLWKIGYVMFVLGSVIHESPNLSLAKLLGSQQNLFFDPSAKNHQHKTYKTALLFWCLHKSWSNEATCFFTLTFWIAEAQASKKRPWLVVSFLMKPSSKFWRYGRSSQSLSKATDLYGT